MQVKGKVMQVVALLLSAFLLMFVSFLLGWHLYLLFMNKTTIEYHEGVRAKAVAKGGAKLQRPHPYDLGDPLSNLEATFGHKIMGWAFPIKASAEGSGLSFPVSVIAEG